MKDGDIVFDRGYGFADLARRIPMSADETIVRPGSIAKLFTAIAVLQLADERRVDLDRDVNLYLDFRIPTPAGSPAITLRNLLTHRGGFENHLKDLIRAGGRPEPLGAWVRRSLPARLFPSGEVPAYSNYGYALAGYVVERVAGERFEDYAARRILAPLGMQNSTFEQPLPAALAPRASRAYWSASIPALPSFEVIPAPAGGLSATATDMGRFMIALLDGASLEARGVLRAATLAQMMAPLRLPPTAANNVWMAFEETEAGGRRFIAKHGLTTAVVSDLELLPEERFGIFVSYNSLTGRDARDFIPTIASRLFMHERPATLPPGTAPADAATVAGTYQPSQREESSFVRLLSLPQQVLVTALPDGRLTIRRGTQPLQETAPLVFERGDLTVSFRRDRAGGLAMRVSSVPLAMEWQPVPFWLSVRFVAPALASALALIVGTLALWPLAALVRRRRPSVLAARDRRDYLRVRAVLAVDVVAVVFVVAGVAYVGDDITKFNATLAPWLVLLYVVAWAGVVGAALVTWIAVRFWRERVGSHFMRVHHAILALSTLIVAWFFVTWRIAGTTLTY